MTQPTTQPTTQPSSPYDVKVEARDGRQATYHVHGWAVGDPSGWLQLIYEDHVTFYPLDLFVAISVPKLENKEETQ